MAQKFGGKYSPDGQQQGQQPASGGGFRGAKRSRVGGRVNLLFIAPLPLIWQAFTSEPVVMLQYLAALGVLLLAAWMTREGLFAQEAYDARKVARRPALPRKMLGSVLTAAGLGLAGIAGHGPLDAIIFAVIGGVLHSFAFGFDPMRDKGMEGVNSHQTDRVARAVEEAEAHLSAMREAIMRAGDRALERRVDAFQTTARDLFRTVEEDPRDLTAARRYLGVYLLGARDATTKFADLYSRTQDAKARADYAALLDDLEKNFAARTQKLLLEDRGDLNVEIDVLRERLEREGLHQDTL
ncbi:5-bromo-4-chloroindolyl phosphate hydrolysis family protein [Shimia sp. R9_1]|uniref:5-bromo-4-chloroindolyl phosphate hydrolysis family protein n=1 Tax=Shimia sp. R9_1 TaxID=2821111 RepID=UPI001ADD4F13|nr:5-bromo-4-chloroindolyl phosphate hydrolysis family protein [Shimia sp. R9_1]MBO9406798.1 5-bromo-4-chloroindolyl phosphate hydrolysis family protein [Shimia sp. R9_1]